MSEQALFSASGPSTIATSVQKRVIGVGCDKHPVNDHLLILRGAESAPHLRDPEFTRVLIVTVSEATPVHEATQLQNDLRRAEIEPFAWVSTRVLHRLG